ncbi:MAG: hypothetical protein ABSG33_04660 [Candidatus Bathyarchaeia archaeon]
MPLTESATFKTKMQRHNRITVPKLLRWRYKIEPTQLLKVTLKPLSPESYSEEEFLAKMAADGRLTVPKLTMEILQKQEEKDLTGCIFEVTISPAGQEPGGAQPQADVKPPESTETKLLDKIDDIRKTLNNKTP